MSVKKIKNLIKIRCLPTSQVPVWTVMFGAQVGEGRPMYLCQQMIKQGNPPPTIKLEDVVPVDHIILLVSLTHL
jgi:hypothetical protein